MILINLLPHREARRQARKRAFYSAMGLAALIGLGVVVIWYGVLQQATSTQEGRNSYLSSEIRKLDEQIKDVATLRAEIDALKARQQAVEDLQSDRNMPVFLLDELVKQCPEGVFFTAVKQAGGIVTISGLSLTNERVSELLRNTAYNSAWLEKPELVEIKATNVLIGKEQRKLFDFNLKVSLKRPQAPAKAASAGAAAPAASAGKV